MRGQVLGLLLGGGLGHDRRPGVQRADEVARRRRARRPRSVSSRKISCSTSVAPRPPYSVGQLMPGVAGVEQPALPARCRRRAAPASRRVRLGGQRRQRPASQTAAPPGTPARRPWPAASRAGLRRPDHEVLPEHLADLVARQLVDRLEADRHLVRARGARGTAPRARVDVGGRRGVGGDDERPRAPRRAGRRARRPRRRRRPPASRRSTSSTSPGKTFSPPRLIMSDTRPSIHTKPSSSTRPMSPVRNQPSAVSRSPRSAAVGVARAQRRRPHQQLARLVGGRRHAVDARTTPSCGRPTDAELRRRRTPRESAAFHPTISPPISVWP